MTVRQLIPEGLAEMVPGPELGALRAGIDIRAVTGGDAVEVLRARARQLSHEQARLLAAMVEVGLCDPNAVTGSALPVDEAAAACAHVEELARAAKRAGHPGRIGPLRADIYLGLLDGRWQHCNRDQIIADLFTRVASETDDCADPGNPADPDHLTDPSAGGDVPAGGAPGGDPTDSASAGDAPAHRAASAAGGVGAGTCRDGVPAAGGFGAVRPARRVRVELRVGLSTLRGWDRHPGEVAGWGPVTAEVARTVVCAQRAAEWRYALTASTEQLLLAGITRRREPTNAPSCAVGGLPACRGEIVELHLPVALLTELAAQLDACGEWARVVVDIAAQYTQYKECGRRRPTAQDPTAQDPTARFAGAALRRHVQIRDRACVFMGCRYPARYADLDHTVDHTSGGATIEGNSGSLCRHDHRLKHVGRWRLHQPEPGHFTWISPLGRTYRTQPPPITDGLPKPRPRPGHPDNPSFAITDDDRPILERPPSQPDPPPPARPPHPEPPPF